MIIIAVLFYDRLPDSLPLHFDIHGDPDSFSDKFIVILLFPSVFVVCITIISLFIKISPSEYNLSSSTKTLAKLNFAIGLLLFCVYVGIIINSISTNYRIEQFIGLGFALFLLGTGNYLSKLERNFFIGVRTPWSIVSEDNWNRTHLFAGRLMVLGGLVNIIALFFTTKMFYFTSILILCVTLPIIYSYIIFKRTISL